MGQKIFNSNNVIEKSTIARSQPENGRSWTAGDGFCQLHDATLLYLMRWQRIAITFFRHGRSNIELSLTNFGLCDPSAGGNADGPMSVRDRTVERYAPDWYELAVICPMQSAHT
ncbi:hypothetical protein [Paraburkholderia xenovorans]|uniref:Uncharacterized protein n=1 Tax=Paraburkholderia xenovorans (strain LB400) TaxID=266265 RepID=Q13ZC3_PARXL|nr:hypothetical protein [Paraburkholderia xenovorans]ABE30566.1 hypothetical protein Bxe_A2403 [Paraburkholderia xenovorans LB400]